MAKAVELARLRLPSGRELRAPRNSSCVARRGMVFIRPERVEIVPAAAASGDLGVNALAGVFAAARSSATSCATPWTRRRLAACSEPHSGRCVNAGRRLPLMSSALIDR